MTWTLSLPLLATLLVGGCTAVDLGRDEVDSKAIVQGPAAGDTADAGDAVEAACGTRGGSPCGPGLDCIFPEDAECGATDKGGSCQIRPLHCTTELAPVCGCDGITYSNECSALTAGVSVQSKGACGDVTNTSDGGLGATCGTKGTKPCGAGLVCLFTIDAECGATDKAGTCRQVPTNCSQDIQPVCGCDGKTYTSECKANGLGISAKKSGGC